MRGRGGMQIAAYTVWILIHPACKREWLSLCTTIVGARKPVVIPKRCISEIDLAASKRYKLLAASASVDGASDGGWTFSSALRC